MKGLLIAARILHGFVGVGVLAGSVLVILSLIIMYRNRQFPVNRVMELFQKTQQP